MKEIEVKILEINVPEVVKRLEALGAKKVLDTVQEIIIYDNAEGTLSKGQLLRLRKNGEVIELTYKKRISKEGTKISDEKEVHVSDFETTRKILQGIGLKEVRKTTKHRISYHLHGVGFEIDTYPGIPTFLEIETEDEKLLEEYVKKLGFTMKDAKPWTGKDVFKHYGKLEEVNL
jgi:adenylate cyclase class 2